MTERRDVLVRVRSRVRDESDAVAHLYDGIFDVTLNGAVDIVFVPSPTDGGSLLDQSSVPWNLDELSTVDQARRAVVIFARYVVTPDDARAGTAVVDENEESDRVVFFVTLEAFARLTEDLTALSGMIGDLRAAAPMSTLHAHPALEFVQRSILRSPLFRPQDATALARPYVV